MNNLKQAARQHYDLWLHTGGVTNEIGWKSMLMMGLIFALFIAVGFLAG